MKPNAAIELSDSITLPSPPKSHRYLAVPEDIRPTAINSEAIIGFCRIDQGDMVAEIDERLQELNIACLTLGKKGKFTLCITLTPAGQSQIEIDYDVSIKAPKCKKHPSLLFISEKGQLLSRNPNQMEMDLRTVATPDSAPLRVVEPPAKSDIRRV
jgi:hypothetical protein